MTSSPGLASCSFNPRTPCGVRRHQLHGPTTVDCFNPRIPCGVRHRTEKVIYMSKQFQSTHSLRSATLARSSVLSALSVSIHALLAECDSGGSYHRAHSHCFNPRTPCGVRRFESKNSQKWVLFQSTHSLRSATSEGITIRYDGMFQSTHSLRSATAPDHIHCYSTAQTILCANLPEKAIIT